MVEAIPEKGVIGKKYRKDAKPLLDWLGKLANADVEKLEKQLAENGYVEWGCG